MNRVVSWFIMTASPVLLLAISFACPVWLSDHNKFLKEFVGSDMLSLLGVVVTITLASIANVHFELNKIEEANKKTGFRKSRAELKQSANWLIASLPMSLALVVVKPWVCGNEVYESLANSFALLIVLFDILMLIDVTKMAFIITPNLPH